MSCRPTRRAALVALLASGGAGRVARVAVAHTSFGPVSPPAPAPALTLLRDDGAVFELRRHLEGNVTAVQLVFTRCTATCPIQAALFAAVATRLRTPRAQLLSLSIDPAHDDGPTLAAWRARHAAPPMWRAAAPRVEDVDRMLESFKGRASGADRHTAAVYVFDEHAKLVFRTAEMPRAAHVVDVMTSVSRRG